MLVLHSADLDSALFDLSCGDIVETGALRVEALTDLIGFDPLSSSVTDSIQIGNSGADSLVHVDRNVATSGASFAFVGYLTGINGLTDEAALVTNGTLVLS